MYTHDKKNRITLRLNDKQFAFVKESAELVDVSPSDFLRMVINATMVASTAALEKAKVIKEAAGRENDKTNSGD
jgi:uncharacterized protein (DUF1778 family)